MFLVFVDDVPCHTVVFEYIRFKSIYITSKFVGIRDILYIEYELIYDCIIIYTHFKNCYCTTETELIPKYHNMNTFLTRHYSNNKGREVDFSPINFPRW